MHNRENIHALPTTIFSEHSARRTILTPSYYQQQLQSLVYDSVALDGILSPSPTTCQHFSTFRMLHIWLKNQYKPITSFKKLNTKSNVRLSPDGILSPSPCSSHFQKRLQNLAYGSLPSIDPSRWHLKPISDSSLIHTTISSLAYDSFPSEVSNFSKWHL